MDWNALSVIMRGSCLRRGKMLTRDDVFGEDMILASDFLRDTTCPRTYTFLEVMMLFRDSLLEAAGKFPELDEKLRRAQVKLALWRAFIHTAEQIRARRVGQTLWDRKFFESPIRSSSKAMKASQGTLNWSWMASFKGEGSEPPPPPPVDEDGIS